jgi:hypothetical protein
MRSTSKEGLSVNGIAKQKTHPRRKIDFSRIGNKILVTLNQKYLESRSYYVLFEEIAVAIPDEPRNAIRDELKELRKKGTIAQRTETKYANPFGISTGKTETYEAFVDGYTITRDGISEINKLTDEAYEVLLAEVVLSAPDQDVATDAWTPLPIERESTEFKKAVEAAEEALTAIESSNGYAASDPQQRNSIIETLKSNLKNLKDGLISKGQIVEGLIKPFRSVAVMFAEASVGELAKRAANFLWTLIVGS